MVEIAIASIVVGTIMALALPQYRVTSEKTLSAEGVQIISSIWQANNLYILENNGANAPSINNLQVDIVASNSFNAPVINPVAAQIARIDRSTGYFSLYISTAGDVTCDDDPTGWIGLCTKMGYTNYD